MVEAKQGNHSLKLSWDNLNRLIQSDNNGQITEYGYDVFGRRLYKKSQDRYGKDSLTLFGWDGDLMVWESKTTGLDLQKNLNRSQNREENQQNNQDYTKHYIYEPNSFVPVLQTGYRQFIQLIKTPDYSQFKTMPYSIHRDPVWSTDTRKNKAELERVAFYHCDQVGTPQTLSNEKGECIWEITLNTWGKTQQINSTNQTQVLEQTNIRFQGQYYDEETGLHYNRYRYYEPHSGRYISKDPIGLQGGLNNLAYVSDPNQWVDPMGLMLKMIFDSDKQTLHAIDRDNPEGKITGQVKLSNVFSGGSATTNPDNHDHVTSISLDGQGLPKGKYAVIATKDNQYWYSLYKLDGHLDDFTYDDERGRTRSGFRLHAGRSSHGCVTFATAHHNGVNRTGFVGESIF